MVIRGWRVVQFPATQGEALKAAEFAGLGEALAPLIGLSDPAGSVLRDGFKNEVATGVYAVGLAKKVEERSLSLRLYLQTETPERLQERDKPRAETKIGKKQRGFDPVLATELPDASPNSAYLLLHSGGNKLLIQTAYVFAEVEGLRARALGDGDEAVASFVSFHKNHTAKKLAPGVHRSFLVAVPPGEYVLTHISPEYVQDFFLPASQCFGAPSVRVAAGEVVDLGLFSGRVLGPFQRSDRPDLSQKLLAPNPALAARLKPAEWTNGNTFRCEGVYAYAYEIPGAPFKEGYAWGSKAARSIEPGEAQEAPAMVAAPGTPEAQATASPAP